MTIENVDLVEKEILYSDATFKWMHIELYGSCFIKGPEKTLELTTVLYGGVGRAPNFG